MMHSVSIDIHLSCSGYKKWSVGCTVVYSCQYLHFQSGNNFSKFNIPVIFYLPYIATGFPYELLNVSQWSHILFHFILQVSFPLIN